MILSKVRLNQAKLILTSELEDRQLEQPDQPPCSPPDKSEGIHCLSPLQKYSYDKHFCHNQWAQSVYDLSYCYFLNKEYMRAINLIEKNTLAYFNYRFTIIMADAYF